MWKLNFHCDGMRTRRDLSGDSSVACCPCEWIVIIAVEGFVAIIIKASPASWLYTISPCDVPSLHVVTQWAGPHQTPAP